MYYLKRKKKSNKTNQVPIEEERSPYETEVISASLQLQVFPYELLTSYEHN